MESNGYASFFRRSAFLGGRRGATRGVGFLEALRFVIMTLVGFTLLRPERVTQIVHTEPPEIVVLADASASMQTRDVALSATNILRRAEWLDRQVVPES